MIHLAEPVLDGNEERYVLDALRRGQLTQERYVQRFEDAFAAFCRTRHAVACSSGTAALHLALLAAGVGPGDEVIVPDLTFVATANAVLYCGATPVFCDVDYDTWCIDPLGVGALINRRTKAIIAVHLYGQPADMRALRQLADHQGLALIEDAAEAHGATVDGRPVGGLGHIGCFSFYGNKILTTGEGGMVTTNDPAVAERVRLLRGQGQDPQHRYWHTVLGYNYRMTDLQAAIGLAQVERAPELLAERRQVWSWYRDHRADAWAWQDSIENTYPAPWLAALRLRDYFAPGRERLVKQLGELHIEARPMFYPLHTLPHLAQYRHGRAFTAEAIANTALALPLHPRLSHAEVQQICETLKQETGRL